MPTKDKVLNERDTKLVQWLNEAHAKEAEPEVDLSAHIKLTQKAAYKKRLQAHLKETKEHKRSVARRIKQLGGVASTGLDVPGVPTAVGEAAGKTVAAVKGQLGAVRALVTEQPETHLRNAQEELREEQVEIEAGLQPGTVPVPPGESRCVVVVKTPLAAAGECLVGHGESSLSRRRAACIARRSSASGPPSCSALCVGSADSERSARGCHAGRAARN